MMLARIFLLIATIGLMGGCVAGKSQPLTPPSAQMTTLTGTLRGGMMAIGGETTGWTLARDDAAGGVELDVSKVMTDAKRLEGKRVSVTGRMIDKKYVERGTVRMMRVESIKAEGRGQKAE